MGPPTDVPLWVMAPVAIVEVSVELLVRVISSGACSCCSRSSTSGIGTYAPPPTVSSALNDIFRKKSPLFFRLEDLPADKAAAAFHYIDDNDSGRVAQSELLNAVVQIFRWGFWGPGSGRQAPTACSSKRGPYSNAGRPAHCDVADRYLRELIRLASRGCLSHMSAPPQTLGGGPS